MHICKVELENFKSHQNSTFEFACGTTSITGENGAGKTSIIEAIAWTIFDTLDYKKEDIVRRGAKKGVARVTFESGLDDRQYTVYRDTGTGYYIFDPQLKARIAEKKEEVKRFLWQHLGIEPGTDLESLFKHAVGVPQGTFTAIFLSTPAERKKTFDTLLKVEEYRRSSDELLKTVRHVEQQIAAVDVKIARAEGEISRIDVVEQELKTIAEKLMEWELTLKSLETKLSEKRESVAAMDTVEARLAQLSVDFDRLRAEAERAQIVLDHRKTDLARSREASERVESVKADAEAHQSALGRLIELERERVERQKLRDELSRTEAAVQSVNTERRHLNEGLEKLQAAHREIESLRELAREQERLEHEAAAIRLSHARSEGAAEQLKKLDERLPGLRQAYKAAADQLALAKEKALAAAELDLLQSRDAEIVRELANANAALERDQRFQSEIRNGLCPILSQRCLNLKEGETLESFVSSQFSEVRSKIDVLVTEQAKVGDALRAAREADRFNSQISVLETRVNEIGMEGTRLKEQRAGFEADAEKLEDARRQLQHLDAELKRLDNPKARISVLEREVLREGELREKISSIEKNLERLESDLRITVEKLESYKDLDVLFNEAVSTRDRTAEASRVMVANQAAAAQLAQNESAFSEAQGLAENAGEAARSAESSLNDAARGYDREAHHAARTELNDLQRREAEARALFDATERRRRELAAEVDRLYEIRKLLGEEFRERDRLKRISETTEFIRTTLREAAPLVARNYVHHVSLEANQMFREIGGDAERTLKWTDDYGILLEEGGYDRPFQSLSGGEQMAAAISVRLALLKQLSDIHIAFFDEPTTNMDAERRENLAMQIGRISHFDQLFVISHDDTFEGYMDHEVKVGR